MNISGTVESIAAASLTISLLTIKREAGNFSEKLKQSERESKFKTNYKPLKDPIAIDADQLN